MDEPRERDFYGLYREGWGDRIVAEAFAHPAKVAPALARRIVRHGIEQGWWVPGRDVLVDPFAGIGGCLLAGGWQGLQMVGVELEPHFVALCEQNIALHDPIWGRHGNVRPVVVQGDSRELGRHVARAMGSLASPPFGSKDSAGPESLHERSDASAKAMLKDQGWHGGVQTSDGNLARLPMAGSVGSPPYADDAPGAGGLNTKPPRKGSDDQSGRAAGPSQAGIRGSVGSPPYAESLQNPGGGRLEDGFGAGRSTPGKSCGPNSQLAQDAYGTTPGQLGAMPAGSVASPPYEECGAGKQGAEQRRFGEDGYDWREGTGDAYGESAGQLGNERGDTFWDALRIIATQLRAVLAPGAVSAWVVKDFVRKKQRVPFCDDCATLLAQCGFTVFERWRCWQISRVQQTDMFTGATTPQKSQKGFFRRLAESKGSPPIDFEEVLWFAKPPGSALFAEREEQ